MRNPYDELKEDILDEKEAITETVQRLHAVASSFNSQKKDYIIEPAMGTYLMNFYSGIENILKRVCKEYYNTMPKGDSWHKELLVLSYNPPAGKIGNVKIYSVIPLLRGGWRSQTGWIFHSNKSSTPSRFTRHPSRGELRPKYS